MNPRVFVLTLCTFAFGSAAFIFAGLLEPMAKDLGVSTAVAGQLQTAYVLTSALLGPVAAWGLGRLDRKLVVITGLSLALLLRSPPLHQLLRLLSLGSSQQELQGLRPLPPPGVASA